MNDLVSGLLAGEHRALARVITLIENREPGYRDLVSELHEHTGGAAVVGVTGSPGAGKSTLVDKLTEAYRDRGATVGVIAVDPASPFSGGAVLGDRVRMSSTAEDMDVFVRSMSARGTLGGLSAATADAVKALDAFGKDVVFVETVGAGQNEIDVVKTADTVAVLVTPGSGDDVQMLKAGILEIADVFAVNKADVEGVDRTVRDLRDMIEGADGRTGSHRIGAAPDEELPEWTPPIVETVAVQGEGIDDFLAAIEDHRDFLRASGLRGRKERIRFADEVRTHLREDLGRLVESAIQEAGGMDAIVDRVVAREADPYTVSDELLGAIEGAAPEAAESAGSEPPS